MSKKFTALAQANVDHYNEHPKTHFAMVVVYWYAASWAINQLVRRAAMKEYNRRTGYFWN